jgi:hypothetical protein
VDFRATDLVGISGITQVLLVYTCQQGVYPRDHVLPLRLPSIYMVVYYFILYFPFFPSLVSSSFFHIYFICHLFVSGDYCPLSSFMRAVSSFSCLLILYTYFTYLAIHLVTCFLFCPIFFILCIFHIPITLPCYVCIISLSSYLFVFSVTFIVGLPSALIGIVFSLLCMTDLYLHFLGILYLVLY